MNAKVLLVTLALFVVIASAGKSGGKSGSTNTDKITICHVPYGNPSNAHPITIDRSAWKIPDDGSTTSQDKEDCYANRAAGDATGNVAKHCPGGHGGDYVLVNGDTCGTQTDKSTCKDICRANSQARENSDGVNADDNRDCANGAKKINICHIPPGNTGKVLSLSIGCAAWKSKTEAHGHYPGGHGGDYAGLACPGPELDSDLDNYLCGETLTICTKSGKSWVTKNISPCFWTISTKCDSDEYGPNCNAGDQLGACPPPPLNCKNGQAVTTAAGTSYCDCPANSVLTSPCVQTGTNSYDCTNSCKYCDPAASCNNRGTCNGFGNCDCQQGYGGANCVPIFPPNPPTPADCTSPFASGFYGFNVISFAGGYLKNSDIEGSAIFGGSLKAKSYSIGAQADGSGCNVPSDYCKLSAGIPGLVAASASGDDLQVCGGYSYIGNILNLVIDPVCTTIGSLPFVRNSYLDNLNLQAIQARKVSSALSTLTATDSFNGNSATITLNANGNAFQNFQINCQAVEKLRQLTVVGAAAGATLSFTFTGNCKTVTLNNVGFSASITSNAERNLFNFPNTARVNLRNTELPGLLLAPLASISGSSSAVNGQVIADSLSGEAQIRNKPFVGCVKADLTGVSGTCQNQCPGGVSPDPNTCICPCANSCPFAQVPGTCECFCDLDCPLGQQPDNQCSSCVACPAVSAGSVFFPSVTPCSFIPGSVGCTSPSPFHVAKDFSVFVLNGGFTGRNNHVGGRIAANGNVDLLNFLVADEVSSTLNVCDTPSVVASGKFTFPNNGRVATGTVSAASGDVSQVSVCSLVPYSAAVIDFNKASTCINAISDKLFKFSATGKASFQKDDANVFRFVGSGSNPEVFNIDASDKPFAAGYWALEGVDAGATIVINIEGDLDVGVGFANLDMSEFEQFSTHTIFNFDSDNLSISGVAVQGSVLAPNALVSASNGRILGHLVANNVAAPITGTTNGVYVQWLGGFTGCLGSDFNSWIASKGCLA